MATMVGAGAAVLFRRPPAWMMALSLGLAAGVMTGVSLSELLPEGISVLLIAMPGAAGIFAAGAAAAAGALFAALLEPVSYTHLKDAERRGGKLPGDIEKRVALEVEGVGVAR